MAVSKRNKTLWANYEQFGRARGRLVAHILSGFMNIARADILDFGCGTGGIALELASLGAQVAALDMNVDKIAVLEKKIKGQSIKIFNQLPDAANTYDAIILLDVIEHLMQPDHVLKKLYNLLKPPGVIYLSTPNKLSLFNFMVDPHFSLPIVSILKRQHVKRVLADWLTWQSKERMDFPELLSLKEFDRLMARCGFEWQFVNSQVADFAFENPASVWNRNSHLQIVNGLKKVGLTSAVHNRVSDKVGLFNIWLNPTWYIIAQKKARFRDSKPG